MTIRSFLLLLLSACTTGTIGDPPELPLTPLANGDFDLTGDSVPRGDPAAGDATAGDATAGDPGGDCNPQWQSTGPCDCAPGACSSCVGTEPQSDGCGGARAIPCTLEATCERDCCAGVCCGYGDLCIDDLCQVGCWDECLPGEHFCQDNAPWICGEDDGDECRDRVFGPECAGTTPVCEDATCVCSATSCTGGKICNGQTCVNPANATPDMVVTGYFDPATQILQQTICNQGDTFAPGPEDYHEVAWYMADPPGSAWRQIGDPAQHSPGLADEGGECSRYDGIGPWSYDWFAIPTDRPLGMRFVVDPNGIFDESDETNNEWSATVCLGTCP